MAYVIQLGGTVVFALGAPLASAMARDHAERRSAAFMRRTTILLAMTVGLGAGGVLLACLAGGSFLRLVYAEQFAAVADVFVWVMVGAAFHYVVLMCNNVLTAARLLGLQPLLWGVALLSTTAMGWLRIPPHGALGAAQAFAFGVAMAAALAIGSIVVVVRDLHRRERAG
jgi:O-antigen/teichoic acid export membrane protein